MKISAFHKTKGDMVEWWQDSLTRYDVVYKSKVFDDSYSTDLSEFIYSDHIVMGGTGYGVDNKLPDAIEHIYPDYYSLYPQFTEAYGFLHADALEDARSVSLQKRKAPVLYR